jgi:hypothetical protein
VDVDVDVVVDGDGDVNDPLELGVHVAPIQAQLAEMGGVDPP